MSLQQSAATPGIHPRGLHASKVFLLSGGSAPATSLHFLLLLAGDIHPNPGPVWLCPACSRNAAKGSVLCTTCNQWWHLSCAGIRYSRNLSAGWTCQPCSTTSTQPLPARPSAPPAHQPVTSTTAPVTRLHSTSLSTSGSSSGPPHTSSSTFRILQFNLAGLRSRQVELLKFLQDEQIDVACVQETNLGGGAEPPRGWQLVGRMDRRVNRDGQPTRIHNGKVAFLVQEGVHYEDKPDVATSAVAPNDDTTECSAIKIHDPRLVKPVTILNV